MADTSPTVSLEDSPATILLASPAVKAEEVDPLADSPVGTTDQDTSPSTPVQGHSLATGQGHSPGTPEEGHSSASPAQGIPLSTLSPLQLNTDCAEIVESMLSQALTCSEQGVHGLGEDTSCLSPTCSLGGVDPINDLSGAIAELVSSNSRFRRKALYNCPKCQNILVNATNCVCGSKSEFPRVLFRKAFAKAMALLSKINSLAKSRPIDSVRTHVTVHRWASYIMTCHTVGYAGLLSKASGIKKLVTCNCFAATMPTRVKTETVLGVTATPANHGSQKSEVGITNCNLRQEPQISIYCSPTLLTCTTLNVSIPGNKNFMSNRLSPALITKFEISSGSWHHRRGTDQEPSTSR